MRAYLLGAAALAIGVGFAIGRVTAPSSPEPATVSVVERGAPAVIAPGTCVAHLGDDDLRRLRDEVVAAIAPGSPAAAIVPPAEDPPPPPTPEQLAAEDASARLLDTAIAAGRWTDADAAALRGQLGTVPDATRIAMLQRMAVAINSGRLHVDTTGAPF